MRYGIKSPTGSSCSHAFIHGKRAWNKPTQVETTEPPYRIKTSLPILDGGEEANRLWELKHGKRTKRRYRT